MNPIISSLYHPVISQSHHWRRDVRGSTRAGGSMAIPCCQWWRLRKVSRPKTSQARSTIATRDAWTTDEFKKAKKSCDVITQSIDMHRLWHRYRMILMMTQKDVCVYIYICIYMQTYVDIYAHIYTGRTGLGVTKYGMILQICRGPSLDCGYYRQQ